LVSRAPEIELSAAVADCPTDGPATTSPLAGCSTSDKRQRWSNLPDGDTVYATSRDRLATVADCQTKLAGNGWLGGGCHCRVVLLFASACLLLTNGD